MNRKIAEQVDERELAVAFDEITGRDAAPDRAREILAAARGIRPEAVVLEPLVVKDRRSGAGRLWVAALLVLGLGATVAVARILDRERRMSSDGLGVAWLEPGTDGASAAVADGRQQPAMSAFPQERGSQGQGSTQEKEQASKDKVSRREQEKQEQEKQEQEQEQEKQAQEKQEQEEQARAKHAREVQRQRELNQRLESQPNSVQAQQLRAKRDVELRALLDRIATLQATNEALVKRQASEGQAKIGVAQPRDKEIEGTLRRQAVATDVARLAEIQQGRFRAAIELAGRNAVATGRLVELAGVARQRNPLNQGEYAKALERLVEHVQKLEAMSDPAKARKLIDEMGVVLADAQRALWAIEKAGKVESGETAPDAGRERKLPH